VLDRDNLVAFQILDESPFLGRDPFLKKGMKRADARGGRRLGNDGPANGLSRKEKE
jgi:hypothetical protein